MFDFLFVTSKRTRHMNAIVESASFRSISWGVFVVCFVSFVRYHQSRLWGKISVDGWDPLCKTVFNSVPFSLLLSACAAEMTGDNLIEKMQREENRNWIHLFSSITLMLFSTKPAHTQPTFVFLGPLIRWLSGCPLGSFLHASEELLVTSYHV